MSWSRLAAVAVLNALVLAASTAEAGGYFVQVVWCGGQTYRIRESSGSAEATVDPHRVTTAHIHNLLETSQDRIVVDRKLAWGSSLRARRVPGAHVLDWVDRPSGEPQGLVGLRVVYVPSLADVPSASALAAELRDRRVSILITDVSDYERAVALISAARPRAAIVATNAHEVGSKALLAKYPTLATVRTGEARQGVSVTNNAALIFSWRARIPPLAVLSTPTVRCDGIASDGSILDQDSGADAQPDAVAPTTSTSGELPAPSTSAAPSRPHDDRRSPPTKCGCDVPGRRTGHCWAWLPAILVVAAARKWNAGRNIHGKDRTR